jgi:hypothetical protein
VKAEPLAQTRLGGAHRCGETGQTGRYVPLNSFKGTVAWGVFYISFIGTVAWDVLLSFKLPEIEDVIYLAYKEKHK